MRENLLTPSESRRKALLESATETLAGMHHSYGNH